jgi:hypothetical protein
MATGPWLTLQNCKIYYLSVFNRDTGTIFLPGSLFTLWLYPTILKEFPIYPGLGEGTILLTFQLISFIRVTSYPTVTIYPARFTALLLPVSRPLFTLSSSAFAVI